MKTKKGWETESLEWIHKVRADIDEEIRKKGMTPEEWIKSRSPADLESLCRKLGLRNYEIEKEKSRKAGIP